VGSLLSFVVRGRTHAIGVATLCLLLPLTSFLAGGVVGLVTLRHGIVEGGLVLAGTAVIASTVTWTLFGELQGIVVFTLMLGLPVLVLAEVLRVSASQGLAVTLAGALGAVPLLALHLGVDDPTAWWRGLLERLVLERVRAAPEAVDAASLARIGEWLDFFAPLMSLVVVWFVMALLMVLFLARWWHALLDNPGGFGREFRALRLDHRVAYVSLALGLLAWLAGHWAGGLPGVLLYLAIVLHGVQGAAIAHYAVAARGLGAGWLWAMYAGLAFVPLVIVPLAVAGFSDTWMDWRRRLAGTGAAD
jgi:hypothetical protein